MSTCRQIDALIARRAQLMTHEVAELEAHLAGCDSCRELARAVKPVEDGFAFAATSASDASEGGTVDERGNVSAVHGERSDAQAFHPGSLDHRAAPAPVIVPVYDAGRLGDRSPFYAMKLVSGRPLDKAIAETTTLAQRLALLPSVLAIADAMAYAHSERVIHRDRRPLPRRSPR